MLLRRPFVRKYLPLSSHTDGGYINQYKMNFDGVNESITCGTDASLDMAITDTRSFSIWAASSSWGGKVILSRDVVTTEYGFIISVTAGLLIQVKLTPLSGGSGAIRVRSTTAMVNNGALKNIIVTYSGSGTAAGVGIHINGGSAENSTIQDNLVGNIANGTGATFRLGSQVGVGYFSGTEDEVAVWDKVVDGTDISGIYNGGTPPDLNQHVSVGNIISWWRMGEGATFDGTNWTIPDEIGSNTGTSVNMESVDRISF